MSLKKALLEREQYYINILINNCKELVINQAPIAGSTQGLKQTLEFKSNRTGKLIPM